MKHSPAGRTAATPPNIVLVLNARMAYEDDSSIDAETGLQLQELWLCKTWRMTTVFAGVEEKRRIICQG